MAPLVCVAMDARLRKVLTWEKNADRHEKSFEGSLVGSSNPNLVRVIGDHLNQNSFAVTLSKQINLQLKAFIVDVVFAFNYVSWMENTIWIRHIHTHQQKKNAKQVHKGQTQRGNFHLFDIKTRFAIVRKALFRFLLPSLLLLLLPFRFSRCEVFPFGICIIGAFEWSRYAYNSKRSKRFSLEICVNY